MEQLFTDKITYEHRTLIKPKQTDLRKHSHDKWELYFFINGDTEFVVNDFSQKLQKNDLIIIKPQEMHYPKLKYPHPQIYESIIIDFSESALPKDLILLLRSRETLYRLPFDSPIIGLLRNLTELPDIYGADDACLYVKNILELIILTLKYTQTVQEDKEKISDKIFSDILRYIDAHLSDGISLSSVANAFYISPSWLAHSFKIYMGIPLMQYVNRKKMLYAQNLLDSGIPAMKVAEKLSYDNYSTFYRLYKKHMQRNPKQGKR